MIQRKLGGPQGTHAPSSALTLAILLSATSGCGRSSSTSEPAIPVAREPEATVADPLTPAEVQRFLSVAPRLPGQRVPEFQPLARPTVTDQLAARALADAYRREFRATFDTVAQGNLWRRDRRLQQALAREQMEPEQLASLVTRISCAISAEVVSANLDMDAVVVSTEQQLETTIGELELLDEQLRLGKVSDTHGATRRREQLVEIIQQTVALSEFGRLLQSVPPESVAAVREFRQQLAAHLPPSDNEQLIKGFETRTSSEIVPTSYESRQ